jgi:hypothetical protein
LKNKSNRDTGTSNNDGQGHRIFNSNDVAFTTIAMKCDFSSDVWILDNRASCHYFRSTEGLTDVKEIDESIKIGNGDSMKSTKVGNLECEVNQVNGEKLTITLNDVKYVPNLFMSLFSLIKSPKKDFKVSNEGVVISLTYKYVKLTFDRVIHAADACLNGVSIKPIMSNHINGCANASIITKKRFDHLHKLFVYCGQELLNNTIKMYGFKSSGNFDTCEQCAIAKAQ